MLLFTIFGLPLFTLFVFSIYRNQQRDSEPLQTALRRGPLRAFLKGIVFAFFSLVVIYPLERIIPASYHPFRLYLFHTIRDHLLPFFPLAIACFLQKRRRGFTELLFFVSGFYSLLTFVGIFINYGRYYPYNLLLLPILRMALIVYIALLILHYREWYGLLRALHLVLIFLLPLAAGGIGYLYQRFFLLSAWITGIIFLSGSVIFVLTDREIYRPEGMRSIPIQ